jgi:hypothetical protein
MTAWGGIVSGAWLWRAPSDPVIDTAADIVALAVTGDQAGARERLRRLPEAGREEVARALVRLGLMKPGPALAPTLRAKERYAGVE